MTNNITIKNNPYLQNLQDQTVKEGIVQLIHSDEYFAIFAKKNIEFYGSYAEYIGTQPLEGVEWNKNLESSDFKKIPEVFSCTLPILLDNVYPSIQNKTVMKRAMQTPQLMAELGERLMDDIKLQASRDIKKEVLKLITEKDNYNSEAWEEWAPEELKIDTLDKAVNLINWVYTKSSEMLEESTKFNKGYQKPGNPNWNEVITNSASRKNLVVYFDRSVYNPLRIRFLSDVSDNSWVDLKNDFADIREMNLDNNAKVVLRDINSLAYTIIAEEGINSEVIPASGSTKFYFHPTVVGGNIPFANACALVSQEKGKGNEE